MGNFAQVAIPDKHHRAFIPLGLVRDKHHPRLPLSEGCLEGVIVDDEFLVGYLRIVSASEYPLGLDREKHHPRLPLSEGCLEGVTVDDAGKLVVPSTLTPSTGISGAGDCGRCFSPSCVYPSWSCS